MASAVVEDINLPAIFSSNEKFIDGASGSTQHDPADAVVVGVRDVKVAVCSHSYSPRDIQLRQRCGSPIALVAPGAIPCSRRDDAFNLANAVVETVCNIHDTIRSDRNP